jgi:hypothetical protein
MRANIVFAVGMWFCALAATACGQDTDFPIQPHAESQMLIEKWATLTAQPEEHFALLARLFPLAGDDYRRFVQQVAYFIHNQQKNEQGGLRAMAAGTLLEFCRIPRGKVVIALAPYLYGNHAQLRKLAWQMFMRSLGEAPEYGYGDLSHIVLAVKSNDEEIAAPLKRAIFEVAPNAAFRLFFRQGAGMEPSKLLRAEHTLDIALFELNMNKGRRIRSAQKGAPKKDPPQPWKLDEESIAALRDLATSEHWWARMFASEFMYHNKDFRLEELIEKLEQDENNLVRQSAASITTPDPLRAPVGPLRP